MPCCALFPDPPDEVTCLGEATALSPELNTPGFLLVNKSVLGRWEMVCKEHRKN